jgi:ParB-like chromosome segregation protein Spo0J
VVVSTDYTLIAGYRRLEASRQLGWTEVPVHVVDLAAIVWSEFDENMLRKGLTPSERVAIADTIE